VVMVLMLSCNESDSVRETMSMVSISSCSESDSDREMVNVVLTVS